MSLNSHKFRHWMLATALFLCCICIWPGTYYFLLKEAGPLRDKKCKNKFCLGVSIMGVYEKALCFFAYILAFILAANTCK